MIREEEPPEPSTRLSTRRRALAIDLPRSGSIEPAQLDAGCCAATWTGS